MDTAPGICLDSRESISYIGMSRSVRKWIGCKDCRKGREKERRLWVAMFVFNFARRVCS